MTPSNVPKGFIIRILGADYYVVSGGEEIRCSLRGRFRIGGSPEEALPVVGDTVEFRRGGSADTRGPSGLVLSILPRNSIFARSNPLGKKRYRILGANLDHVILVFAVREPELNIRLLDRMLVAAGCGHMNPVICFNKMDLADKPDRFRREMVSYEAMGYEVIFCSARDGEGLERLRAIMGGAKSIMVGPSGAGKTSIVAALEPGLDLRIAEVSDRTGKGRHTTSHFELHPLAGGGYLGDSPGVREFGIWGVSREDLDDYFLDFTPFIGYCRFAGCTHSHEPGCAIKEAVENGSVLHGRYESYLRILEELPDTLP
ncbi:MAG TPA: ribosome small subunit-dependent GTPase A [Patescibacteria group bacterium]|nr:ribosome small subunit-dependent GTPase A [Patescibacteria group bacterium]